MKRLRDERDALSQELSREQALSARFAEVIERLRGERDDAREQLATAHADVDDLLEWKASTSLEAQRRLMCPRMLRSAGYLGAGDAARLGPGRGWRGRGAWVPA